MTITAVEDKYPASCLGLTPKFTPPEGSRVWTNDVMQLNVPDDSILQNIEHNIKRHLPQARPYNPQPATLAIVGGGWSLEDTEDELRDIVFDKAVITALNGAGNWLVEHNFQPKIHYIMDAREESIGFVKHRAKGCRYLIASQCDPSIFDALEGEDVTMFHVVSSTSKEMKDKDKGGPVGGDGIRALLDKHYKKRWNEVPGAGTIGMVSLPLSLMLGYSSAHLFGIDSCYPAGDRYHHAYDQKVNDGETQLKFECAGRDFICAPWQASQANNFIEVTKALGSRLQLSIHGDGLLAHMVETGSQLSSET